jgi:GNAT superfamily N-acetyltransferase
VSGYVPPERTGDVRARVWRLQMRKRPSRPRAVPPADNVQVVEARSISTSFYRYLYDTVGAPWCWTGRRLIDDQELSRRIHARGVEIDVLWVDGVPGGFVEIDAGYTPGEVFIAYFGLIPEFIGRGLGRFFLDWAVDRAWELRPQQVRVQTCDLDHPAALPNYKRAGFECYGETIETVALVPGVLARRRDESSSSITSPS